MAKRESKLHFYGGTGSVTGANFLLDTGGTKVLIDCGITQGGYDAFEKNYEDFPYAPAEIDVLIVTHAHADHIGRIPKLVRDGFRGVIYSTPATRDLSEVMFADAVRVLHFEAKKRQMPPLYEPEDIEHALSLWQTHELHSPFSVGDDVTVTFRDAGHILGASMAEFEREGVRFLATGDLGNSPAPLLPDTEVVSDANYILMESVYGDRAHEDRDDRIKLLSAILKETYEKKRTLLIPSFAMQRTQLLLYEINKMVESGEVPEMPVFLDSPLATAVTDVYRRYTHIFNTKVQSEVASGDDIFDFPKFSIVRDAKESQGLISVPGPKVIIAGSGMSVGGRILLHEKRILGDPNTTILFVGYQGVGTLGRRIQDGEKTVHIDGHTVRVRAQKATIRGFSAHKDRDGLVAFVEHSAPKLQQVFVAMGEPKSALFLVQRLRDFLGVHAVAPEEGDVHILTL